MVNFRNVTITNESGTDSIELNDFDGFLMTAPAGFGIYRNSEYFTIGNNMIRAKNTPAFRKITMTVSILGERSEQENKYARLRDFISNNIGNGFRLYYTPQEQTRYIKCDINIVDKSEKERGYLPIKLEIQPLSLWLTDVNKQVISQTETVSNDMFVFMSREEGIYAIQFDLIEDALDEYARPVYAVYFGGGYSNKTEIENIGNESTPLIIRLYGKMINPVISLRRQSSGRLYQSIKFHDLTINEGYYVEINSDPVYSYINLINQTTGERIDIENLADIESSIYITLPKGKWTIDIENENEAGSGEIFFSNQFYGG